MLIRRVVAGVLQHGSPVNVAPVAVVHWPFALHPDRLGSSPSRGPGTESMRVLDKRVATLRIAGWVGQLTINEEIDTHEKHFEIPCSRRRAGQGEFVQ